MSYEVHSEVYEFVKNIPRGKVMNYGAIGRFIGLTGRQVGSIMGMSDGTNDNGLPWWRVLGHDGSFSIAKKDPVLEKEQRERLMNEGVPIMANGKVNMRLALWDGEA
jgi:methylated-DNA-protein-cysteine methyltransferase-like protein